MTILKKAASGGFWLSLANAGTNLIDFLVFAYLARILTLEEFGLAGFCFLFIEFANTLVESGANQNLIQRKEWNDSYAASTLTFVCLLSVGVILLIFLIGVPIALYTYSALAALVIASLTPITFITSLQVIVNGKLLRDFRNKEMTFARFLASVISALAIIFLAENNFGVWALIVGKLVNSILLFLFYLFISKLRLHFNFDKSHIKELIDFCLPILGMTMLSFFQRRASVIYTGLILGPVNFALLSAARKGEMITNQITMGSINSMVVPSFSRVKDKDKLGSLFIRMVCITATLVFPIYMGLASIADPFVELAFGEKFNPSAVYMTISAFIMFPNLLGWFLPSLLISIAETKAALKLTTLSITSTLLIGGATIWFGVKIMLIALVLAAFILLPFRFYIVNKYIDISLRELLKRVTPPAISAIFMFVSLLGIKHVYYELSNNKLLLLFVLLPSGLLIYSGILFLFFRNFVKEFKNEITLMIKK